MVASQAKSWMKIRQVNMWIPISFLQTLLFGRSMLLHGAIVYLAEGTTCWQSGWNVEAYCRFPGCLCELQSLECVTKIGIAVLFVDFLVKTTACMTSYLIRWLWIIELLVCLKVLEPYHFKLQKWFWRRSVHPSSCFSLPFQSGFCFHLAICFWSLGQTWWEWNHLLRCKVAKI